MAPLKEADALVGSTTPAENAAKNPPDAATRTQPVALEIPVTINGAHTVAGSDKREPFSETTQTVLVFAGGAVVRVSTSLAPGQLIFLTNEKTKKEVVCQVLKSKNGGSGGGYVELQFTEPAPGFWGLRLAGASAPASPAPKPVAAVPAPPKPVAPVTPIAPPSPKLSEPTLAKPTAPTAAPQIPSAPAKPADVPPAPALRISPPPPPPAPVTPAPLVSVPPPSPLADAKEHSSPVQAAPPAPTAQDTPEPPAPASSVTPPSSIPEKHSTPPPALHDYSKEIDALFTAPSSHPPASHSAPVAPPDPSVPSSEQLKADAARLQAQLSSLLFSEPSSAKPASPLAPPPKPSASADDLAQKVFDISHDEPKPAVIPEAKIPIPPARKPAAPVISAEEQEVKIPAWLAPLSPNAEPATAAKSPSVESADEISAISDGVSGEAPRSEAAVFGGQLLGAAASETPAAGGGSKKGLWIAIAALVLLSVAGAAWYLRADLFGPSKSAGNKPASPAVASSAPASRPALDSKPSTPAPVGNGNTAPAPVAAAPAPSQSQPAKSAEPSPSAALASAAARELKSFTSEAKKPAAAPPPAAATPAAQPEEKSALEDVHLATPRVNRATDSSQGSEALPSIDPQLNSGGDALAAVETHSAPKVPLPIGGDVQSAELIKSVPPVYPPMARSQHVSGNVQIDALIDASGNVADLKILSGPTLLYRAALDAVKQWKYKPAMLNGQPTSMHLTVTVQFRAQ